VSALLPHEENIIQVYNAFSNQRRQIIDEFWDESELQELDSRPEVESWSSATHLLRRLWRHLPFGRILDEFAYEQFVTNLGILKEDAREQLFYWYTAGPLAARSAGPIDSFQLFSRSDHLWFTHIAPIQQYIKEQIRTGRRIRYLDYFYLDYDRIELNFKEIRLITVQFGTLPPLIQTPHRLVICPGRTHHFRWSTTFWETNLDNPDQNLTDPTDYRLPPQIPATATTASSEAEYIAARNIPTPPIPSGSLTAPTPPPPLINRISID